MRGGPHGDRARAHDEGGDVEEVGQVAHHVEAVVEGQHEQVARQVRDVVPHDVLLERRRRRHARLIDDAAQPPDHLRGKFDYSDVQ